MRKVDCTAPVLDLTERRELRAVVHGNGLLYTCENLSPNSSLSDCMAFRTEFASLPDTTATTFSDFCLTKVYPPTSSIRCTPTFTGKA